jgi:hypothetical protein
VDSDETGLSDIVDELEVEIDKVRAERDALLVENARLHAAQRESFRYELFVEAHNLEGDFADWCEYTGSTTPTEEGAR